MELINIEKEEEKINMMAPLTWAYIGDAVFELYIRTYLINKTNLKPHKLHVEAIKYVKAPAQAKALQKIEEMLTDKEKEIVKKYVFNAVEVLIQKGCTIVVIACNTATSIAVDELRRKYKELKT